ncbi:hypothetical protein INR49_016182 [Caranx melampygus]|nr:hypothetical protein INR49_016182 [Caranx melampygus]
MAEPRRVQLTTLSCDVRPSSSDRPALAPALVPSLAPSLALAHKPSKSNPQEKHAGLGEAAADTATVRLVLKLLEPDERSFQEFSYTQLIDNKINHTKVKGPLRKYEEEERTEDDEVAAIARRLEEKYGDKPTKKKDRIQDLIDIGYGYDEEDSFIDNSEAYDEFVPASITTKFGGFYVNSGVLHFRQASDTESDDLTTEENRLESSKKRKLNGGQDKPKKKKKCVTGEEMQTNTDAAKSSTLSENGPRDEMKKKKKKKKAVGTLSVTSMLKKFQKEKEKERQKMEKANQKAAGIGVGIIPTIPLCPADAAGGGGLGLTDPLLSLIGSTNDHSLIQAASTVDFDIDLVSLLDASEETSSLKLVPQVATETNHHTLTQTPSPNTKTNNLQLKTHPEQIQLQSEASSASPQPCVPLPEGLTPALEDSISRLIAAAKTSEGESKLKFFTPEINSILLDIELQCREHGGQLRSKVYTHLSSFLPCSRDTLLKRVKRLLLTHTGNRRRTEGRQSAKVGPEDNVEERGGKRGGPKKVFKWNEEIRECLCHVLRPKIDRINSEGKGSQKMEEYLKTLLDSESLVEGEQEGTPPLKVGLPQDTDDVCAEGSNVTKSITLDATKKAAVAFRKVEGKKGEGVTVNASTCVESGVEDLLSSSHSLLNLLADQALAPEQPPRVSQELLTATVAQFNQLQLPPVQLFNFKADNETPPLPPPCPPSGLVCGFPVTRFCGTVKVWTN